MEVGWIPAPLLPDLLARRDLPSAVKVVAGVFGEVGVEDENGVPIRPSALFDGEQNGVFINHFPTGDQAALLPLRMLNQSVLAESDSFVV